MVLTYLLASITAFGLLILFFNIKIALRWKKRKWLSRDFWGIGISFLVLMAFTSLWFATEQIIYMFAMSLSTIAFNAFLSYAVLRMLYPDKGRPKNWFLIIYLTVPIAYLFKPDLMFISLQIMLMGASITFISFALLSILCKRMIKMYAASGMITGLFGIIAVPLVFAQYLPIIDTTRLVIYTGSFASLAFAFYGLYRVALKSPDHFVCDYDHRKDGH